jgi:hypothetical protein
MRSTPTAAAIDSGATVRARDITTRRRCAQGATNCHAGALRKEGAVGLDIDTSSEIDRA